jgi:hypothetical protein
MPEYHFKKDFRWTASDMSEDYMENNIPRIYLYEYEQTFSAILGTINYWMRQWESYSRQIKEGDRSALEIASSPENPISLYEGLYIGKPTGNNYVLPYYEEYNHTISQAWAENRGSGGILKKYEAIRDFAENLAKVVFPAAGISVPKAWEGPSPTEYTFTFNLLNTVDVTDVNKNRDFLRTLITKNLHLRHNPLNHTPPSLYEVQIPGIRYAPVAVITGLDVKNIGNMNWTSRYGPQIQSNGDVVGGPINVPDGYRVTIKIFELFHEDRFLFNEGWHGKSKDGVLHSGVITSYENSNIKENVDYLQEQTERFWREVGPMAEHARNQVSEGIEDLGEGLSNLRERIFGKPEGNALPGGPQ